MKEMLSMHSSLNSMLKRGLFIGPAPKGREFTIVNYEPNGVFTITGIVADDGVIYITNQEWRKAKKYGESVFHIAHSLVERIKSHEQETKQ